MPQHKVSAAVNNLADLKDLKADQVIRNGKSIIEAAMKSTDEDPMIRIQESFPVIANQAHSYRISKNPSILKGANEGVKLAKGLMEHA